MEGVLFSRPGNSHSWKQKYFVLLKKKLVQHAKDYKEMKAKVLSSVRCEVNCLIFHFPNLS